MLVLPERSHTWGSPAWVCRRAHSTRRWSRSWGCWARPPAPAHSASSCSQSSPGPSGSSRPGSGPPADTDQTTSLRVLPTTSVSASDPHGKMRIRAVPEGLFNIYVQFLCKKFYCKTRSREDNEKSLKNTSKITKNCFWTFETLCLKIYYEPHLQ